jgi:hypothetical protein
MCGECGHILTGGERFLWQTWFFTYKHAPVTECYASVQGFYSGLVLAHLDNRAAAFGHALTTSVAFVMVEHDLAAELLLRVLDVANGSPWTQMSPWAGHFRLLMYDLVSRLLKALEFSPAMASRSPAHL